MTQTEPQNLHLIENKIKAFLRPEQSRYSQLRTERIVRDLYSIDIVGASELSVDILWNMPDRMGAFKEFRTYEYLKGDIFRMIFDFGKIN